MDKCYYYGTVQGCSKCEVDLTNRDDIAQLSTLSIFSILLRLTEILKDEVSIIILDSIQVLCNGIIRLSRYPTTVVRNKDTAWASNKFTITSILTEWMSTNKIYVNGNDNNELATIYVNQILLANNLGDMLSALANIVSLLETI